MASAAVELRSPTARGLGRGRVLRGLVFPTGLVLAVLFGAPLLWTIVTSVKPAIEASAAPPTGLPSHIDFSNYATLETYGSGIVGYTTNSLIVASVTIIGTLVIATLAGFGFSRFEFPLKGPLFLLVLAMLMIPFQSIAIPMFILLRTMGLTNSLVGLGLVYVTFQAPFSVFVMRNAFDQIPREIEDAAIVDGCTTRRMLWMVMLPLVVPGLVTIGLFAFLAAWTEFYAAFILLSDQSTYTLPIMLLSAQGGVWESINWGALQAGVTVTMLPCLVLYVILQRYYIIGVTSGAVKG